MEYLYAFAREFLKLTWEVLPYFLGGAAFGAALDVYLKPEFALKHLRGGWLSMAKAAVLGMIMPGCSCATMPMAEGLRRKGAERTRGCTQHSPPRQTSCRLHRTPTLKAAMEN